MSAMGCLVIQVLSDVLQKMAKKKKIGLLQLPLKFQHFTFQTIIIIKNTKYLSAVFES